MKQFKKKIENKKRWKIIKTRWDCAKLEGHKLI